MSELRDGSYWVSAPITQTIVGTGAENQGEISYQPDNLVRSYWAQILPKLGYGGAIWETVVLLKGTIDEESKDFLSNSAILAIEDFRRQGYDVVRNPGRTQAGSKNVTEYGFRLPSGELASTWEYVAGSFFQQISPYLGLVFPAVLTGVGSLLGVAASNTAVGVTIADVVGSVGSTVTGQVASSVASQVTGSAIVSAASAVASGGDAESALKAAILGAAGGVAKPYISDALDYLEGLLPGEVQDLAAIAEVAYQEQVGVDLAQAQAGAIYDFEALSAAADAAALASEIQTTTVAELLAPVSTAPIFGPPAPGEISPPPSTSSGKWGRRSSIFGRRSSLFGGSYEDAELAADPLLDQVAFPPVDTVAPVVPAEVLPLGPSTVIESAPITSTDIIESVGAAVDNIEGDYDWLFGYSDPVADFAEVDLGDFATQDPADFFWGLEDIDAGYIPSAQDVASNVGYVEAGSFQPVANTQSTFDQIIRNVTVAAGTALTLVRAWREIDGPEPNTVAQARVGGSIVRANPDGTITSTNAAGQTIRTLPAKGQPQMATDGSMIVNNGDGSYTRITPDGRTTVQRYGTTPAASSGIAGISTPLLIGAGALLVFAVAGGRRA
jgi:hypothetical protein